MPQRNKAHKGKFSSKGELKRKAKGRIEKVKALSRRTVKLQKSGNQPNTKLKQLYSTTQARARKRAQVLHEKRIGTVTGPPKVVAFLSLSTNADPHRVRQRVTNWIQAKADNPSLGPAPPPTSILYPTTVVVREQKQRLTLLSAGVDLDHLLDCAKVADIAVLVIRAIPDDPTELPETVAADAIAPEDEDMTAAETVSLTGSARTEVVNQYGMCIDALGQQFLSILTAVGLPTVMVAIVGFTSVARVKLQKRILRLHTVYFRQLFGEETKVVVADRESDIQNMVRSLCLVKLRTIHWRQHIPYLLVDKTEWTPATSPSPSTSPSSCLSISGYLRGQNLSANGLLHLPHLGTFQIHAIYYSPDPYPATSGGSPTGGVPVLAHCPDSERETLGWCKEVDPDGLGNVDQTWPTKEDEDLDEEIQLGDDMDDDNPNEDDDNDDEDKDEVMDPITLQHSQGVTSLPATDTADGKSLKSVKTQLTTAGQTQIENFLATDLHHFEQLTPQQRDDEVRRVLADRQHAQTKVEEDRDAPDEMLTPLHIPARQRFLRYRGLDSFKASQWDPSENLPLDYARIYQFQHIKQTWKRIQQAMADYPIPVDRYVTIVLENMSPDEWTQATRGTRAGSYLVACGLRKHEHKWSMSHYALQMHPKVQDSLKSKDCFIFHVGFRSFSCCPVFSEHNARSEKHKYFRYFHPEVKFAVASLYGPITFPPTPVLCFSPTTNALLAFGATLPVNPQRIILKKVALTGQLYRIHKRQAVIRFMFHSVEDVNWFKPVKLCTKLGVVGHILGPLGTHGYMKCQFSSHLRADDKVYLPLYKRVFPKWGTTLPLLELPSQKLPFVQTTPLEEVVKKKREGDRKGKGIEHDNNDVDEAEEN